MCRGCPRKFERELEKRCSSLVIFTDITKSIGVVIFFYGSDVFTSWYKCF